MPARDSQRSDGAVGEALDQMKKSAGLLEVFDPQTQKNQEDTPIMVLGDVDGGCSVPES